MTLKESLLTPRLAVFTLGGDTPLTSYGANCVVFAGYHFNYEEADLKGLPAALDALRSIQAERFVPGTGRRAERNSPKSKRAITGPLRSSFAMQARPPRRALPFARGSHRTGSRLP